MAWRSKQPQLIYRRHMDDQVLLGKCTQLVCFFDECVNFLCSVQARDDYFGKHVTFKIFILKCLPDK